MTQNQLSVEDVKEYLRVYDDEDDAAISTMLSAAKSFIQGYTGLSALDTDKYEDLTAACLVLVAEMYDNRLYTVDTDKINPIAKSIMDLHAVNLL